MTASATARARPEPTLPPRTRIGQYEVLDRIAVGGMAELYLARRVGIEGFEKRVVLKRVLPALVHDAEFTSMFLNEARLAARLDHPNIVQVMDIGVVDDEFFFVMEYLHGKNLRGVMREATPGELLPLDFAINVAIRMAAGLHHAHECRDAEGELLELVHRDVSPQNVIVTYDGHVKLVDFGIAKAAASRANTQTGTVKGKSGYMAPELFKGLRIDRRADIFAVGVVLYELTIGRRPFQGDNQFAVLSAAAQGRYDRPSTIRPDYPEALEAVVVKCLAADREERYATAEELQNALEEAAERMGARVSPSMVRNFMRAHFEVPALLSLPIDPETEEAARSLSSYRRDERLTPDDVPTTLSGPIALETRGRRWGVLGGAIAVTLMGGVALGVWMASRDPAGPSPDPEATLAAPIPAETGSPGVERPAGEEGTPVAEAVDEDAASGGPAAVASAESAVPVEVEDPVLIEADDEVAASPDEVSPARTSTRRRTKRPKRSTRSSDESAAPSSSSLFPPSHRK